MFAIMSFAARKRQLHGPGFVSGERSDAWMDRPLEVGARFGIDPDLWNRNWAELSGGEGQRIMMAIGVALGTAEVLLLDGELPLSLYLPSPFPQRVHRIQRYFLTRSGTFALIADVTFIACINSNSFAGFSRV
jgi:translation initiation factor RLI1